MTANIQDIRSTDRQVLQWFLTRATGYVTCFNDTNTYGLSVPGIAFFSAVFNRTDFNFNRTYSNRDEIVDAIVRAVLSHETSSMESNVSERSR